MIIYSKILVLALDSFFLVNLVNLKLVQGSLLSHGLSLSHDEEKIWDSVSELKLDRGLQKVDLNLPTRLRTLALGANIREEDFKKIKMPDSLENLTIKCNHSLSLLIDPDRVSTFWPSGLKNLRLVGAFNQKIEKGYLPESLHSLEFGSNFQQSLDEGVLPDKLQSLILADSSMRWKIVRSNNYTSESESGGLLSDDESNSIAAPSRICGLCRMIGAAFRTRRGASNHHDLFSLALPSGLQTLFLGAFNQELLAGDLPKDLKHLKFGGEYNIKLERGVLPIGLKNLEFGYTYIQKLEEGVLPTNLQSLKFTNEYFDNNPTLGLDLGNVAFPQELHSLELNYIKQESLREGVLPKMLTKLSFKDDFNLPLYKGVLPETLQILNLPKKYEHDLLNLPSKLKVLWLSQQIIYSDREIHFPFNLEKLYISDIQFLDKSKCEVEQFQKIRNIPENCEVYIPDQDDSYSSLGSNGHGYLQVTENWKNVGFLKNLELL